MRGSVCSLEPCSSSPPRANTTFLGNSCPLVMQPYHARGVWRCGDQLEVHECSIGKDLLPAAERQRIHGEMHLVDQVVPQQFVNKLAAAVSKDLPIPFGF